MPKFDSLGDRMKFYEGNFGQGRYLMPLVPWVIRLDGKAFHSFTRGFDKPFDSRLMGMMSSITKNLVEETGGVLGYTQSDEISLILYSDDVRSQGYFDGKVQKIQSVLASLATSYGHSYLKQNLALARNDSDSLRYYPTFDCRCFTLPTKAEACNYLIWREQDALRNSIQAVGQSKFPHAALQNKNCDQIQEMLMQVFNINWSTYDPTLKRGSYFGVVKTSRAFSESEIAALPEKHLARSNPSLLFERRDVVPLNLPIATKITNLADVIFTGAAATIAATSEEHKVEN